MPNKTPLRGARTTLGKLRRGHDGGCEARRAKKEYTRLKPVPSEQLDPVLPTSRCPVKSTRGRHKAQLNSQVLEAGQYINHAKIQENHICSFDYPSGIIWHVRWWLRWIEAFSQQYSIAQRLATTKHSSFSRGATPRFL